MSTWRNDWTGFFVVYFKWCYYLCVSPFRFEWDEHSNKFRIKRNPLQNLACVSLYFLLGLWYLKDLRKIPVDHLYKNPVVYFSLAFNLNAIYYHICVLSFSFWRQQGRFLAIVNFECEGYATSNVKNKLVAVFLCFLFAILPLLYSICGYTIISSTSRIWDPALLFRCLVVEGRFAIFLNGNASNLVIGYCSKSNNALPNLYEISVLDCILGGIAFLMEMARQIVGFYSDFFTLICCLSIWTCIGTLQEFFLQDPPSTNPEQYHPPPPQYQPQNNHPYNYRPRLSLVDDVRVISEVDINDREKSLQLENGGIIMPYITKRSVPVSTGTTSAPVVREKPVMQQQHQKEHIMEIGICESSSVLFGNMLLERYEMCKSFSRTVNRALGQLLFAYVLSSIMYLSTCMDDVLVLQDWFGKLRVAFFFFIFILMFFIGSEIVNKVYGMRAWLSDPVNNGFLTEKTLLVLIHEITCKSIGVTGNGMFTVTYSTFMTVMTTTVTFFIIILQFQKPRGGDWGDLSGTISTLNSSLQGLNTLISQLSSKVQTSTEFTQQ